ncbi:uncharacterized protein TA06855 [Theileria annulata]|uniref:Uncharacterized protein n=1 Tax=Theileria annulata TaxID=5874 RepID=Q4UHU2_THEAN|nr:uncharacterized protein TA06855 [Theileria annulata]CAI73347.1 hypothetical protein TA06855 [Theileria annulata]|eukprot:XP_954024.1 hypothetical protein TA06855 [Theileria annulata]
MTDSTLSVEKSRNKFYETKNRVNSKLGEHLNRSRSLLSDVRNSLLRSSNSNSRNSQSYHVESFAPFKEHDYKQNFNCGSEEYKGHLRCDNIDSFRCSTRFSSPCYTTKGGALGPSETPKHMTQAMWLLNTSNITCNLSDEMVEDTQEKIPEILLKDPADLLRGEGQVTELKNQDKLTEILNDKTEDNVESSTVKKQFDSSISYDILSTLDFHKKTVDNKPFYGSDELINKLLNESNNSLDKISNSLNLLNSNNILNPKDNGPVGLTGPASLGGLCNIGGFENLDVIAQEFVRNSGIDFRKQSEALTETLLKLNEKGLYIVLNNCLDKLKETELAPKILVEETKEKKGAEPEKVDNKFPTKTNNDLVTGLETDLLSNFSIIKDTKVGRKMYRLSDFDKKFKTSSKCNNSVQVQTDIPEPEEVITPKKIKTNVKVVYHSGSEGRLRPLNGMEGQKKQDLYAQKIVSNLKPRLEMRFQSQNENKYMYEEPSDVEAENDVIKEMKEYNRRLEEKEKEKMRKWRSQRAPIYDKMMSNLRSGVGHSIMCRGGKRNSRILHNYKAQISNSSPDKSELYYISPTNRKSIEAENLYGYDFDHVDSTQENRKLSESTYNDKYHDHKNPQTRLKPKPDLKSLNPIDHFEQWWKFNTKELNVLREQLSI